MDANHGWEVSFGHDKGRSRKPYKDYDMYMWKDYARGNNLGLIDIIIDII